MTPELDEAAPQRSAPAPLVARVVTGAAVCSAGLLAVLLAIRPLSSMDLGYHLAYGEHFLETGQAVDTNPYVYTIGLDPRGGEDDLGPGCWYGADGGYHFPNANWLTQVVMAAVYRRGGAVGLCSLQIALIAGTFALAVVVMRRLGLPWLLIAAGLTVMALGSYPRFNLRPELVSYLLLTGQLAILVGRGRRAEHVPSVWSVAALVAIQLLFVNLHSFYVLGVAFTGAFLVDALLRLWWRRMARAPKDEAARAGYRRVILLAAALTGQILVCFVNPWTWRIVALPAQTLAFMRQHGITGGGPGDSTHPWAQIGELSGTLSGATFATARATVVFWLVLVLAAAGALAAILRRRWAWLALMGGVIASAMSVRRNIALASLLATPVVLAALWAVLRDPLSRIAGRLRTPCALAIGGMLLLVTAWFHFRVATNRFYYAEYLPARLGVGVTELAVPAGPARWINEHQPKGRLWCDFNSSSNIHFLTRPHRGVPVMTNTWANPPGTMDRALKLGENRPDFAAAQRRYGLQIVVVSTYPGNQPLIRRLARDPAWAVTYLDAAHVVFLAANGANAQLARQSAVTPRSLDVAAHKAALAAADPMPAYSTYLGGLTLHYLNWTTPAIAVFEEAVRLDGRHGRAWNMLGLCHAGRGTERLKRHEFAPGKADLHEAAKCFRAAQRLDAGLEGVRENLSLVRDQLAALERGVILTPQY